MPLPRRLFSSLAPPRPLPPSAAQRPGGPNATPRCDACGWEAALDHVLLFRYRFCGACLLPFRRPQGEGRYDFEALIDDSPDTRLFRATDRRLERPVSVLYYKPPAAGAPQLAVPPDLRAKHEALALAALQHHSVARIHLIEEEQCRPALVIEAFTTTLAEPIAMGRTLHVPAAIGLLRDLADVLRAAADQGQFHHRLLPDQVGLTEHHEPKLMGLGHQCPTELTPGLRGVEAAFLAPEIRVLDPDADQRADIFSLGILSYALLAGCYPMVPRRRRPVPPVTRFRPDVPPALAGLLSSMIARHPVERPRTHDELTRPAQRPGRHPPAAGRVMSGARDRDHRPPPFRPSSAAAGRAGSTG